MIIARPLVVGVEEVRRPGAPWCSWHRSSQGARPLTVGLRHAKRVHAPLGPLTLPCLTLGATVGLFSPPRWAASWGISLDKCSGHLADRWSERPECSILRQYPILEDLLSKDQLRFESRPTEQERRQERPASTSEDQLRLETRPTEHERRQERPASTPELVAVTAASLSQLSSEIHRNVTDTGTLAHLRATACPCEDGMELPLGAEASSSAPLEHASGRKLEHTVEDEPELVVPELRREDSEWSFLSQSLHTVESRELNELESSDEDRPLPTKTRWRRIADLFWPQRR